jgi:DNA polymerase III epsilon subunit family exonuclease
MKWKHLPIVAFDTETTGLDPFSGDRIIEVGFVIMRLAPDGTVADRTNHAQLINPGIPIPKKITQITGISDSDVADAPPFVAVAEDIARWMSGAVAVAHNYPFDLGFLTQEFERAGSPWHEPLAAIDTVDLSMRVFKGAKGHKLGDLTKRLNVSLENAHRASDDAAACGLCFTELVQRHDVPDTLQDLLDWAGAIGRPPEEGPLTIDHFGAPVFSEGPHAGDQVLTHPLHLAWMEKAKVRTPEGWRFRYPKETRRWVRRWLNVRCAGRARQNPKSFRQQDWVIDPCITDDRRWRS